MMSAVIPNNKEVISGIQNDPDRTLYGGRDGSIVTDGREVAPEIYSVLDEMKFGILASEQAIPTVWSRFLADFVYDPRVRARTAAADKTARAGELTGWSGHRCNRRHTFWW